MSDIDDSFIVLEETPSMLQFSLLQSRDSSISDTSHIENNISESRNTDALPEGLKNSNNGTEITSTVPSKISSTSSIPCPLISNITSEGNLNQYHIPTLPKTTLAQSFLLGDINCDKMKSYLEDSNQKEDVKKWRILIQERNDLKDALQRTNATMRHQYSMVNNWQNSVKELRDNHEKELNKFRDINDELFQQNYNLQSKVVDLQHLANLSRKTCIQSEQDRLSTANVEKEYLEKQIQSLKLELANAIVKNVETEEAHDEANIKLFAIQELFKNATTDIAALKNKNECLQRELEEAKVLITEYRQSSSVIRAQCEVFRNDFELERKQREEMASEREQMIADIKMLKKRNQALIDEAQSYYTETSAASLTSNVSNASIEDNNEIQKFVCPLCLIVYDELNTLESHVQSCLEKN